MKDLMEKIARKTTSKKVAAKKTARKVAAKTVSKKTAKNSLLAAMEQTDTIGLTENGAKTFTSSLDGNVDLFSMGGALRTRSESEVIKLFVKANSEDPLLALKNIFHIRNVRGGAGERKTFRTVLKYLGDNYPEYVAKNIGNVVHFGRFDDLLSLFGTKSEKTAMNFLAAALEDDLNKMEDKGRVSLLGKWLPSENASSKETKALATKFRTFLGVGERTYRKTLSALRAYSNVLEVKLSSGQWHDIDYSKIPSKAGLIYRKAFSKHDPTGYVSFLESVKKGEKTINAGALFPYDIVDKALRGDHSETLDALWNALPNYLEGTNNNILCVCDVSGSMSGLPMAVSISLGIYTSERNSGSFKDYFITFSSDPKLKKVVGSNIREKVNMLSRADWNMSTDLQKTFRYVLDHAVKNHVPVQDMPTQILIISDMEFNQCGANTNLEGIRAQYVKAGYECPSLVFWNVNSKKNNVAARADEKGVLLVSGCSPSVFKTLLGGKSYTPVDQMLETLNSPEYDLVKI